MPDGLHFEGDPATESARRRMERLLNEAPPRRRRWPAVAGMLTGLFAWYFWPRQRTSSEARRGRGGPGNRH